MPSRAHYSICNRCRITFVGTGTLCPSCKGIQQSRPSPSSRGYDGRWRKIRARVLEAAGIPKEAWHLYAVDHNPPYDQAVDPDHTHYELVPRLIAEHNRKTAREDVKRDASGRIRGRK